MFVIDTNILVDAVNPRAEAYPACSALVDSWRKQPVQSFLTGEICFEFLRVTTHPRIFQSPWSAGDAWSFIRHLLASGTQILNPTSRHVELVTKLLEEFPLLAGNIMHDAHTAILMREHGLRRIYTRDTDFHRFPFLEPIDPLRPS